MGLPYETTNSAQGTSQYSITEQDDQIILWVFGMLFATKNNGLFLWRHEFKPKDNQC